MNNLPNATRMPPRTYKIVAMRKYTPIAANGNGVPPLTGGGLTHVTFGSGLTEVGLIKDPKKSESGTCPNAIASATNRTATATNFAGFKCAAPTTVRS